MKNNNSTEPKKYEVLIVGGGVSGTALLYTLCHYTDIRDIALLEKYKGLGRVNSASFNNSQTLHFGDIETNYTLKKAASVKRFADMVKIYLEKEKERNPDRKLFSKYSKMVLAVGEKQVEELDKRFDDFGKLFPNLRKVGKDEIGKAEPRILEGRDPNQKLLALMTEDGYTVDFGRLSRSFAENAQKYNPDCEIHLETKLFSLKKEGDIYRVKTNRGDYIAPAVIIAAGGHSLKIAKSLGYGAKYSILSIAGSFYTGPEVLNGKVYTMQQEKLPFAAIHGDPDVHKQGETRFGPTAKAVFLLERRNRRSFWEYWKTFGIGIKPVLSLLNILSDGIVFKYIVKNIIYDFPIIGKYLFLKEVKKIVPEVKYNELKFAKKVGGTRPQTINNETRKLEMGEAKLTGDNIIFNITPSPGASTCLGNAYDDVQKIMEFFKGKYTFRKEDFDNDLVEKEVGNNKV